MIDREKVIKGLEYHLSEITIGKKCFQCPYYGDNPCEQILIASALELLKEQEPVKPFPYHDIYWCGKCGNRVSQRERIMNSHSCLVYRYKYCPDCGRKVNWDA